ncbi:MAG: hypothetical protein WC346_18210 [Methanogenium sp.]|jgi:hypothetical protein
MGYTNWSSTAYDNLKTDYKTKSTDDIFTNNKTRTIDTAMDPKNLSIREARDSDAHPQSLAIMINLDVTGSMGVIPEAIVREKLGNLMNTLIDHNVKDAAVLFNAIGDHVEDKYPLQVGQFESGTQELNKWLTSTFIESGGGGQNRESYLLAWLVAGRHTSIDCFEKRGQKGFLFTIGDEACWDKLDKSSLSEIMGYDENVEGLSDKQLLTEAQRMYNVFHIHVQQGSYRNDPQILKYWKDLLGERLILLEDYDKISEVIATTVSVILGANFDDVVNSFDNSTAMVVRNSVSNAVKANGSNKSDDSVITL